MSDNFRSKIKAFFSVRRLSLIAFIAVMALGGLGYLDPAKAVLSSDALTFKLKSFSLSAYQLIKGLAVLVLLLWLAGSASRMLNFSLLRVSALGSSNRTLISNALSVVLYFMAVLVALKIFGVDLTALAVFSGAVGVGLGFGLQKITSNFISGIILLFEKTVEEGDLVELQDGVTGFVRRTAARYTLVETHDGREVMIPNEDFITQRVVNWTYSSNKARVELHIGVAYDSDLELAKSLIIEAASAHPRCCSTPKPQCFLRGFGDSSVNFLLYFWVADVVEGRYEPSSDVLLAIYAAFKDQGIAIPFPQREVRIVSGQNMDENIDDNNAEHAAAGS